MNYNKFLTVGLLFLKDRKFKNVILWITYAVLLLFVMLNFNTVWAIGVNLFRVMTPFIYGFLLAYILNFIMAFFEKRVFRKIGAKDYRMRSVKKMLSLVCTYAVAFGVVTFLAAILVPQVFSSFESLYINIQRNLQSYLNGAEDILHNVLDFLNSTFGLNFITENQLNSFLEGILALFIGNDVKSISKEILNAVFPAAVNTASNLYNWFIAIIVSVYFLSCKEKLCAQVKAISYAYMPDKMLRKSIEIVNISNNMCGRFLVGKIVDSIIIGLLCFTGMTIFRFEYALLISVIVGFTNIIPVFGPFIGAIPSAFLLLLVDPLQCLWFVVFIIVLQQLDGNVIGPKILGNQIGVSGFWIMFSVLLGGGLFGVPGMILGVPVFAVIYDLLGKNVRNRLKLKVVNRGREDKKHESNYIGTLEIKKIDIDIDQDALSVDGNNTEIND